MFTGLSIKPMPVVEMKILSPLPRLTTLVSPVTSCTPASLAAALIESTMRRRSSVASPSSRMKAAAEIERTRAAHRQIVHRAVDREPANIAAGEEDGRNHERIGREGEARTVDLEHRLIVELVQQRIAERRQEHLFDQLRGKLAAAAVPEHDLLDAA